MSHVRCQVSCAMCHVTGVMFNIFFIKNWPPPKVYEETVLRICDQLFFIILTFEPFKELSVSLIAFYIYKLILLFGCPEQL